MAQLEWLKRFLKPRQSNFLQLLIQQADYAVASTEALHAFLKKPNEKKSTKAREMEKEADEVRRILIHELLDTFVTPIDREDIHALSRTLDNFIDYVYGTVEEIEILEVPVIPALLDISALLLEMAKELHLAMQRLLDYPGVAAEHAKRAKGLENQVEDVYRHTLADLFAGPEDIHHIMEMLKKREVLRHLSNAADQGDMAADVIMDIVVKWS